MFPPPRSLAGAFSPRTLLRPTRYAQMRGVMLMVTSESQNLPPVLEMVEAVYRGSAAHLLPVGRDRLAQRAGHLAAGVRFGLAEPEVMGRLREMAKELHNAARLHLLLPIVLDGALALTGADFGYIQLLDPVTGSLWLVTQSGFSPEFLGYFAIVGDGGSACGRAAHAGAQAVIADVTTDAGFAPHRDIAAASGFRAVQSTPLADYAGRLVGMVSTHFHRPGRPPARDLRAMELYGDAAGEAIARHLGVSAAGDGGGDPVGRAVLSALLDPGDGQAPDVTVPSGPGNRHGGREGRPAAWSASLEDVMSHFAGEVVNRLFSAGLSLEGARSIIGDGPAGDRVAAAASELDRAIRDIRALMFRFAAGPRNRRPGSAADRWALPTGGHGGPPPARC